MALWLVSTKTTCSLVPMAMPCTFPCSFSMLANSDLRRVWRHTCIHEGKQNWCLLEYQDARMHITIKSVFSLLDIKFLHNCFLGTSCSQVFAYDQVYSNIIACSFPCLTITQKSVHIQPTLIEAVYIATLNHATIQWQRILQCGVHVQGDSSEVTQHLSLSQASN